jgi:Large eukaryotic DNA virus major capsid protein/Major capsid protein N-terminus
MAGGLMQLVAYGAQDVYLTGNPKVTFFQAVYKRHTNFAMEIIEQTVNGTASNDGRISVTIARNGDLIGDMFMDLKTVAGIKSREGDFTVTSGVWAAERAVKSVELSIGGQRIDKHYQRWWRLYSELYLPVDKKNEWAKLTSDAAGGGNKVYLPLIFFFNRNPGLYLPLIALQYHEVRIDFDLASNFSTYLDTTQVKVWGNYIYLDTEERRRFAQKGHEYLIEQVQHTGTDSVTSGQTKQVRLSYNHPVKELVWCLGGSDTANAKLWNFTTNCNTSNAVILESNPDFLGAAASYGGNSNVVLLSSLQVAPGVPQLLSGNVASASGGVTVSAYQWIEDGAVSTRRSVGPLDSFKLILNGQDRFKAQPGKFFNQMQPMMHHSGNPYPGVYCYSFALKPEELQPTGTCNFSRIDNSQVEVTLKAATPENQTLAMFAVNYNVLRIQSGMGGLAFSN